MDLPILRENLMINVWVTIAVGFAVLGVQWRAYVLLRNRISDGDAALTNRASNNNVALWKINDSVETIIGALDEHDTSSKDRHTTTAKIVNTAMTTFENHAETFSANAEKLKVHAQELLDRSEAHAVNPRQAVTRG